MIYNLYFMPTWTGVSSTGSVSPSGSLYPVESNNLLRTVLSLYLGVGQVTWHVITALEKRQRPTIIDQHAQLAILSVSACLIKASVPVSTMNTGAASGSPASHHA